MSQENFEEDNPSSFTDSTCRKQLRHLSTIASSQASQPNMPMPNSAFVPTINAIASSHELQWMVQPAVLGSTSGTCVPAHPYGRPVTHPTPSGLARPGVIHSIGNTSWQRKKAHQETERLEQEQASLQQQVDSLRDERARLELLLSTHSSVCSLPHKEPLCPAMYSADLPLSSAAPTHTSSVAEVKQEPQEEGREAEREEAAALYPLKPEPRRGDPEEQYGARRDMFGGAGFSFSYRFVECNSSDVDSSLSFTDEFLSNSSEKGQSIDSSRGSHYGDFRVLNSPTP
ncbi:fos-related antigen 2 isoform X2 [Engraulis encrasicolus]|uniref:fos-related antigen 2 isoform X2 n=1 Tax=Engraulis encrasicolus TaxID=184585 RepID=UPI002FD5D319